MPRIIDLCAGSGNGVCPRQAAAGIIDCLDELDLVKGHWANEFRDGIVQP